MQEHRPKKDLKCHVLNSGPEYRTTLVATVQLLNTSEIDQANENEMDLLHESFSCVPYLRRFCKLSHLDLESKVIKIRGTELQLFLREKMTKIHSWSFGSERVI